MRLEKKLKMCFQIFTPFMKSTSNLKQFEKKDGFHSLCLSKIIDCKKRAYVNV